MLKDLVSIDDLLDEDIQYLLERAQYYRRDRSAGCAQTLAGHIHGHMFFEVSTRTHVSFCVAGQRLGAQYVSLDAGASSLIKGESVEDTLRVLAAMVDVLIVRTGGLQKLDMRECFSKIEGVSCINAGNAAGEHPTQALLDVVALRERKKLDGLKVLLCGDVKHSRVFHSHLKLLPRLGVKVGVFVPQEAVHEFGEDDLLRDVDVFHSFNDALDGCGAILLTRRQVERQKGRPEPQPEELHEYARLFQLTRERLARHAPDDVVVLHPGPVLRGVEIEDVLVDDTRVSLIWNQIRCGIALRMALLEFLARSRGAL